MEPLVGGHHVGIGPAAVGAPGGPEIHQQQLAFGQFGERHGIALGIVLREINDRLSGLHTLQLFHVFLSHRQIGGNKIGIGMMDAVDHLAQFFGGEGPFVTV